MKIRPNRVAVYLTAAGGLATAIAPAVADLDTTSVAGLIAGLAAVTAVVDRWLKGWQQYELRKAYSTPVNPAPNENGDVGDVLPGLPHLEAADPARVGQDKVDVEPKR